MQEDEIKTLLNQYTTPFYLFDINVLNKRLTYLKKHLPQRIDICYAMKANPFLVGYLSNQVTRLEVCSPGEYYICRNTGVDKDKLVISGVYKTPEVIEEMIQDKVKIFTIESLNQLNLLDKLTKQYQYNIEVLLRLTSGNQFGMSQEEVEGFNVLNH